jgi:glutamyl-Q tRNA(Asp) synthetase
MSKFGNSTIIKKKTPPSYVGRFAPSPTGPLHFGSLIAATASYLAARSKTDSAWLLRMEDLDTGRCKTEYAKSILKTLETFQFQWDGEIIFQSKRNNIYQDILDSIQQYTYPCSCTRKQLQGQTAENPYSYIYPGNCRKSLGNPDAKQTSIRLKTDSKTLCFDDQCQGHFCQNIKEEVGDFILKRSDGLFAYQLAVVVDDAAQGITDIVRGADLFDNTPRQIYLQQILGYPQPNYLHFPVATTHDGKKLSKQNQSREITAHNKRSQLIDALAFLGQQPPASKEFTNLDDLWRWAVQNWDSANIPRKRKIHHEPATKR